MSSEVKKPKSEKKPVSKIRKIISWVVTGIFTAFLAVLATFQIAGMVNKTTYQNTVTMPNYFGHHLLYVLTDSMDPEYPVGSSIVVKTIDDFSEIKPGDDITFLYDLDGNGTKDVVTHRIQSKDSPLFDYKEDGIITPEQSSDGLYHFKASGINKHSENCKIGDEEYGNCLGQYQEFSQNDVIGKVVGNSKILGGFFSFITQWYGLLVVLLIPTIYLIVTSIIDIVKAVKEDDDEDKPNKDDKSSGGTPPDGKVTSLDGLSEEEKQRLKQELINKILEKKKVS